MSSSWGCPNEVDGVCQKVRGALCDPGMMGCVVQGLVERIGEPKGARRPVKAPEARSAGRDDATRRHGDRAVSKA